RFAVQPDERPTPRFQSPAPTAVDLGWRMPLLPALDRALARNHWFRGRLRILSGNRGTLSRNSAGAISALSRLRRSKRSGLLRGGSGLSIVTLFPLEKMVVVELPARSRFRRSF